MGFLDSILRRRKRISAQDHFTAGIIVLCKVDASSVRKVEDAINEFQAKYPRRLVEAPKLALCKDGANLSMSIHCYDPNDPNRLNQEMGRILDRHGVRW